MPIAAVAKQNETNFMKVTETSFASIASGAKIAGSAGSSMSVTSNDAATMHQQALQVQGEIQQLHGMKGSSGQLQRSETTLQDADRRLAELTESQSMQPVEQEKTGEQAQAATLTKPNDVTVSIDTNVGTQMDLYA